MAVDSLKMSMSHMITSMILANDDCTTVDSSFIRKSFDPPDTLILDLDHASLQRNVEVRGLFMIRFQIFWIIPGAISKKFFQMASLFRISSSVAYFLSSEHPEAAIFS